MPNVVPNPDDAAAKSLNGSIAQIKANAALYGVADADMVALEAKATAFASELTNVEAAKNAQTAAVARKDAARTTLEHDYRAMVQRIHVNPAVTDAHKAAAGIPMRDTIRTFAMPPAPLDLVVSAQSNGTNYLAWNRNGAPERTDFAIEARTAPSEAWIMVGSVSATQFQHTGQKPGVAVTYRVSARRGKYQSQPCAPVGVYL